MTKNAVAGVETTRLTVNVSKETDRALRTYLGAQGMRKGDISKFVEEAVRWRIFHRTVGEAREAFTDVSPGELQRAIDDAAEEVRAERYRARAAALMLLILNTKVLLSALLSPRGAPAALLDAWERRRFTAVCCDELIEEFRAVAERPYFRARLRASTAEMLAAELRDFSLYCRDLPSGTEAPDEKDSCLLALEEASGAKFLVTGDQELLALRRHGSTRIVTPAGMVEILQGRGRQRRRRRGRIGQAVTSVRLLSNTCGSRISSARARTR
jgi:putative PIN family toxin of toxin-antitoxin system